METNNKEFISRDTFKSLNIGISIGLYLFSIIIGKELLPLFVMALYFVGKLIEDLVYDKKIDKYNFLSMLAIIYMLIMDFVRHNKITVFSEVLYNPFIK